MGTHTKRRFKMSERKAVIKNADMSEEMQQDAVDCAMHALDKYNIEKDIAAYVKKEFDKKYNPTWHCIVGQLRFICDPRDEALHLLLPRPGRHPPLQVRVNARGG